MAARPRDIQEAGFTFAELLIVLAIIALTASVLAGFVVNGQQGRLAAAAHDVAAQLRQARTSAIIDQTHVEIRASNSRELTIAIAGKVEPLDTNRFAMRVEPTIGAPEQDALTFYPDGGSNGGVVVVSDGDAQARVVVERMTGHVSVAP